MKAIVCTAYGPPEVLQLADLPTPEPKPGQVRIRMHASAVTYSDCFVRSMAIKPVLRFIIRLVVGWRRPRMQILGIIVSGEVDRLGPGVTEFKVGDQVFGMDGYGARSWAEYKCMKVKRLLVTKPASVTFEEAAAIPYGGLLALAFLKRAGIAQGKRILIYGASGATGTSAVQLAKHFGAHVTAVCSAENAALVQSLGADRVLDYRTQDFTSMPDRYDILFAAVGRRYNPPTEEQCRKALAPSGVYATVDGWNPKMTREGLAELRDLADAGKLRPVIDRTYPLSEMVEAHRRVESQRKRGNVVIAIAK